MKHRDDIAIGDAVEIRTVEREELSVVTVVPTDAYLTNKRYARPVPIKFRWLPATVVSVTRDKLGVAFSDGSRLEVARYCDIWRVA